MSNPGSVAGLILGPIAGNKARIAGRNYVTAKILDRGTAATELPNEYVVVQT